MKFFGRFKADSIIRYSVQFHDDDNITVDPTNPAARHRKPDDTFAALAAPVKLDTKTGWYGGSIDTTGFAIGSHEVRIWGTVDAHEVATIISFEIIANTNLDIMTKIPSASIEDYKADVSALAIEANVEGHVDASLGNYNGPTHAEMTAEHDVLEGEHAALSAEHAALSGEHSTLATPAQVKTQADQALVDYDPPTLAEMLSAFSDLNDISIAEVNAACDAALADYDGPTKTEMDAGFAGLNDPTAATIADAIWDELLADHQTLTSFGGAIRVMQALLQQNIVYDSITYTNGDVTSMRIRLFDTAVAAAAATDGGTGEGEFLTLNVTGTFTANQLDIGKVVKA